MDRIKTGIIGLGMMGYAQLRNCFATLPDLYEITCLCESHEGNLKRSVDWCTQNGLAPAAFSSWQDMLRQGDFELAVVVTPDFTHEEIAVACLETGKHLRLEKPMATTLTGCRNIMQAWQKHRPTVQVGFELRYSNLIRQIQQDRTRIGALKMLWCHEFHHPFLKKDGSTPDWILSKAATGGTLLEKNCHHFDLFNMLAAAQPVSVYASGDNQVIYRQADVLDNAFVTVDYDNGVRAMLSLCMFSPEKKGQAHMYALELGLLGSEGRMELRDDDLYCWDRAGGNEWHTTFLRSNFEAHAEDILPSLVELAECIRHGGQPLTGLQAGLNSGLVALAAELSATEKRIVTIEEMERAGHVHYAVEQPQKAYTVNLKR